MTLAAVAAEMQLVISATCTRTPLSLTLSYFFSLSLTHAHVAETMRIQHGCNLLLSGRIVPL